MASGLYTFEIWVVEFVGFRWSPMYLVIDGFFRSLTTSATSAILETNGVEVLDGFVFSAETTEASPSTILRVIEHLNVRKFDRL